MAVRRDPSPTIRCPVPAADALSGAPARYEITAAKTPVLRARRKAASLGEDAAPTGLGHAVIEGFLFPTRTDANGQVLLLSVGASDALVLNATAVPPMLAVDGGHATRFVGGRAMVIGTSASGSGLSAIEFGAGNDTPTGSADAIRYAGGMVTIRSMGAGGTTFCAAVQETTGRWAATATTRSVAPMATTRARVQPTSPWRTAWGGPARGLDLGEDVTARRAFPAVAGFADVFAAAPRCRDGAADPNRTVITRDAAADVSIRLDGVHRKALTGDDFLFRSRPFRVLRGFSSHGACANCIHAGCGTDGAGMSSGGLLHRLARSDKASGLALVSPPFLYALLMLAAPLGTLVTYSFLTDGYLTVEWVFTLSNYVAAWTDPLYRAVMLRSLGVAMAVTAVTVILAFPVAYFVSFHVPANRKSLWLFLITIPFWTSYLIRVFLWKVILGFNGVVNSGLMAVGIIDAPLTFILYNVNSVVITLAHAYAPFAVLPIFVALEKIDRSLLEAGQDLGESRLATFWRVTLPLAMPGVIGATVIVFIPTIGDYVTPQLVGGPEGRMVANLIQLQYLRLDNFPLGSAIALSAIALVLFVIVAVWALSGVWRAAYAWAEPRLPLGLAALTGGAAFAAVAAVILGIGAAGQVVTGSTLGGFAVIVAATLAVPVALARRGRA